MPSKLPIIKANTTQDNIDKMKVIAESNKRSIAKELELLIENYIKDYESIHGEIDLELFKLQKFEKATEPLCEEAYKLVEKTAIKKGISTREMWNKYLSIQSPKKKNKEDFKVIQKYIEKRLNEE